MGNQNGDPPNDYKLDLHFGGKIFPTQQQALSYIAATILAKEPQTIRSLVAAFRNTAYVPVPLTIEPEEAKWILEEGRKDGLFTYDEETREYALTVEFHTALLRRQNERRQVVADIKEDFFQALNSKPFIETVAREYFWNRLRAYVQNRVLSYIQNASQQEPDGVETQTLEEVFTVKTSTLIDHEYALNAALVHFPPFVQETQSGQALFELVFTDTMYAFRTSISRSGQNRMAQEISRYHLILDTNVIITLLGLRQNEKLTESARRVLKLMMECGVKVAVTSSTEEELSHALQSAVKKVERDNAVYAKRGEDGRLYFTPHSIEAAYFSERVLYPAEEFVTRYSNLQYLLSDCLGSEVDYTHLPQEEIESIRRTHDYETFLERLRRPETSAEKVRHDALHLAYVTRQRRRNRKRSYWFITQHNYLTKLVASRGHLEPAIRLDWLFLRVRQLLPRVDNYLEFLKGFAMSDMFGGFNPSVEELELKHQYIESASERHPGEVTHSIFLKAPSHVMREIHERFGLERAFEAYQAIEAFFARMDAASEEAQAQDEADALANRIADLELEAAEREAEWHEDRDKHVALVQQTLEEKAAVRMAKTALDQARITRNAIAAVFAAAFGIVSAATRFFDNFPLWMEVALYLAPIVLGGIVFQILDMQSKRKRLDLRRELDLLKEQLRELKASAP